jgi:Holliday junction resolvase RusA-like endonuclease
MLKKILLSLALFSVAVYATDYECIEYLGDIRVVFKGTRDVASRVSSKRYTDYETCNRDINNFLNGKKSPVEYECIEYLGDIRVVFKGTKDVASRVSSKRYSDYKTCNRDLSSFLNGEKSPVEYECIEHLGDVRVVFKGTKDVASRVSTKRYSDYETCKRDLKNFLNGAKSPVEYECAEYLGDIRVVFKGTKDVASRVSTKRYTNYKTCNRDLDNYLNGKKSPVEYECAEYLGDIRVVFKGTKDVASRVSTRRYTSDESCNEALNEYLSKQRR